MSGVGEAAAQTAAVATAAGQAAKVAAAQATAAGATAAETAAGVEDFLDQAVPAQQGQQQQGQPRRRPRVLLGATGSVAAIKLGQLASALLEFADVRVVATAGACHFFEESALPAAALPVLGDDDEWRAWRRVGDPVLHIELRRWADALLIAPLSANSLAKLACGLCDNLLTCVVRAWDFGCGGAGGRARLRWPGLQALLPCSVPLPNLLSALPCPVRSKPLLVAPAMNTLMWESPFTERHLEALRSLGAQIVPPIAKRLACGDVGAGAMAEPADVAAAVRAALVQAELLDEGAWGDSGRPRTNCGAPSGAAAASGTS